MSKVAIKEAILPKQNKRCALSGVKLPDNPSLMDTDRIIERFNGGTYTDLSNVRIVDPRAHMERHGILREREEWLEHLKALMDDRIQTMKLDMKINNQRLAYERRTDHMRPETDAFLIEAKKPVDARLKVIDRAIAKHLKASTDPFVIRLMDVRGVGPVTAAGMLVYVDLAKADSASAVWKYVGLHAASHERYTKGEAGGGNKTLRTILYNTACTMMKDKTSPYRLVYDRTKDKLAASKKIVKSRNTQGQLVEVAWKDAKPSHRHGAALRAIIKHFLADYWFVGREMAGLPTRSLYVEGQLGHSGIIKPDERGW
jgi:hypothetical protein